MLNKMACASLILIYLSLCVGLHNVFAFEIQINPGYVNGLIHPDVTISCLMESSDLHVKEIMLVEISWKGDPIALVRHPYKLSVAAGMEHKYTAEGNISSIVTTSYLHLTISNPKETDSGVYTCLLYYLDDKGVLSQTKRNDNLTVSNADMVSAVIHLVDRVNELQTKVSQLTNENHHQQDTIKSLIDKESQTVMFTAVNSVDRQVQKGDVYIYNDVIINEGQGYNATSGVFKAPMAGYYQFYLSATAITANFIDLSLVTSASQTVFVMTVGDMNYNMADQYGAVVKLKNGEEVRPVVLGRSDGFHQITNVLFGGGSHFSGYLLKAL